MCRAEGVFSKAACFEGVDSMEVDAAFFAMPQWTSKVSIRVTTASRNSRRGSSLVLDAILKELSVLESIRHKTGVSMCQI